MSSRWRKAIVGLQNIDSGDGHPAETTGGRPTVDQPGDYVKARAYKYAAEIHPPRTPHWVVS